MKNLVIQNLKRCAEMKNKHFHYDILKVFISTTVILSFVL